MDYFKYIARGPFLVSPDGKRLFRYGWPWSRPYIIPDAATEQRLFTKQLWMMRLFLGGLILGQAFLSKSLEAIVKEPMWTLVYFASVIAVYSLVSHFVFRRAVSKLSRAEWRLPFRFLCASVAQGHGTGALTLGLVGSSLFAAVGLWTLTAGHNAVIALVSIPMFGLCALRWGYALYLKCRNPALGEDAPSRHRV